MKPPERETLKYLYRGVKIERRYKGYEIQNWQPVAKYSWVARAPGFTAIAPSLEAIQKAVDSHLDSVGSNPTVPCLGD